jgi:hypothetical protein
VVAVGSGGGVAVGDLLGADFCWPTTTAPHAPGSRTGLCFWDGPAFAPTAGSATLTPAVAMHSRLARRRQGDLSAIALRTAHLDHGSTTAPCTARLDHGPLFSIATLRTAFGEVTAYVYGRFHDIRFRYVPFSYVPFGYEPLSYVQFGGLGHAFTAGVDTGAGAGAGA